MLNIGDRVEVTELGWEGVKGTVIAFDEDIIRVAHDTGQHFRDGAPVAARYCVGGVPGYGGWYQSNLALIEKGPPTDQELADEYRKIQRRAAEVAALLIDKGFTIERQAVIGSDGFAHVVRRSCRTDGEIKIHKTVSETITL